MVLILHQGVDSSRQNRGRFNHAAALLLVDTGTKMLVPAAGKQTRIRHSRSLDWIIGWDFVILFNQPLWTTQELFLVLLLDRFVLCNFPSFLCFSGLLISYLMLEVRN